MIAIVTARVFNCVVRAAWRLAAPIEVGKLEREVPKLSPNAYNAGDLLGRNEDNGAVDSGPTARFDARE